MRKLTLVLVWVLIGSAASAQKVDSIYFHLYTDSLKKGFYNYINIDGKMSDGSWRPLDTTYIRLVANTGFFQGNDLYIDSSFTEAYVKVKAILRSDPRIWKERIIYIRRRGFDEPLKTNEEIIDEMRKGQKTKVKRKGR